MENKYEDIKMDTNTQVRKEIKKYSKVKFDNLDQLWVDKTGSSSGKLFVDNLHVGYLQANNRNGREFITLNGKRIWLDTIKTTWEQVIWVEPSELKKAS